MNVREGIGTEAIHLPWVDHSFPSPPALFEQRLTQIIKPGDRVLDAGCGAGRFLSFRSARAQGCKVVGVDLCDDLRVNPSLDMRAQSDLNALPFADATFDAIVCRMVVEHLRQPKTAFAEFH